MRWRWNEGITIARPVRQVFSPLDSQLRLWDKHWSEQLAKEAVWLSGLVTFDQAAEIMSRVGQIPIASSSAWQRSAKWGGQLQAVESQQRVVANALPARSEVVPGEVSGEQVLGVAMDGAMVHVRQEGWKELKTGCVFEVEVRPTLDKASGEMMDLAHATANTYVAHLGGTRLFGQQVWSEAKRRDWTQAHDSIALGDGAPWIWNLVSEHFSDSRQAVDWYHAKFASEQRRQCLAWRRQRRGPALVETPRDAPVPRPCGAPCR